jgi:lipopolysaccharide/colanic/teichoic acid biosynthesis glycosyltransferase
MCLILKLSVRPSKIQQQQQQQQQTMSYLLHRARASTIKTRVMLTAFACVLIVFSLFVFSLFAYITYNHAGVTGTKR